MPEGKIKVGILGVSGHTGAELLRWLSRHRGIELCYLGAREPLASVRELYPWTEFDLPVEKIDVDKVKALCDCVFLALPHTVSQKYVPYLYPDVVVIDLSADYRLKDSSCYERWYKVKHNSVSLLNEAVYGLPELLRDKIATSRLIANPGCYPTAIILGLFPLVESAVVDSVIIDAKSGASGAGRKLSPKLLFSELTENLYPYKPNMHQHIPEIAQVLGLSASDIVFVPHIVGIERGIIATMYVRLNKRLTDKQIRTLFMERYLKEDFVKVIDELPSYRMVQHTNNCFISFRLLTESMLLVVSAIDNLVKGASGQAIQNMNVAFGLKEKEGLV